MKITTITIKSDGNRETYIGSSEACDVVTIDTVDGEILVSTSWGGKVRFENISFPSMLKARAYACLFLCPVTEDQDKRLD
jgi:hypothetical protein